MASIAVDGVSKVYPGSVAAVDDLHFDVCDGELLVLVGPSGCGKTTTLRMIAGLERPTRGTIRLGGRDVKNVAPRDRNIAMMFQHNVLYPHLTVSGNMAFGWRLRSGRRGLLSWLLGSSRPAKHRGSTPGCRDIAGRVQQAAAMLGIERLLDRRPHELSGGERQRVALGKALVQQPSVFLLDEPLSNLDVSRRVRLREELRKLHQQFPTTTLLVTHDQGEALSLGQRIVVMEQGKVRQVGPPMSVYDQPQDRFVAGFLGTPPMNFWDGELANHEGELTFVGCGFPVRLEAAIRRRLQPEGAKKVTLGIRPEDVGLHTWAPRPAGNTLLGRVLLVEPLGEANLTHVEVLGTEGSGAGPGPTLTARTGRDRKWQVDERVAIELSRHRMHLFNAATGENLTRGVWTTSTSQQT